MIPSGLKINKRPAFESVTDKWDPFCMSGAEKRLVMLSYRKKNRKMWLQKYKAK